MGKPKMEFLGNKVILRASGRLCSSTEEVVNSAFFKEVLDRYIDMLSKRHSFLLDIFGEEEKSVLERMGRFFTELKSGKNENEAFREKRKISPEQRETLATVLGYLCKIKYDEVPKVVENAEVLTSNPGLLFQFVQGLYDYWRNFDRFLFLTDKEKTMKPRDAIKDNIEKLSILIKDVYRDIKENLSLSPPKVFRQVRAGVEMTAITCASSAFPLGGVYSKLAEVAFIKNVIMAPPLILTPPMNKRTGSFVKADKNPVEKAGIDPADWICYPAKAGEVLIYVYIHKKFIELGLSLCNLFEIADEEELSRKPDAVYLYGVANGAVTGPEGMQTVFYEDEEEGILTAGVPGGDEFGYFGYLKKMMLTLHNIIMMKRGRMPFHGAFMQIMLKGGKSANVLMIGDSGAGKSETIEAFREIGDEYIQDLIVIADDMGSLEKNNKGEVVGYGTEIGAFLRIDDLSPGYAFGELDAAIMMSVRQANARLIIPITDYETVMKGYKVDYVLYANNYDESGGAIEKFTSSRDALEVFRSGKVMSKGTTTSTGIVNSYFANIFGPPAYKELHDSLAEEFFEAFFKKDTYVGELRTRLGIPGFERKGPEQSAKALLETILKS
ncbi:MAG: phosphoenolpyruvate carboxykinase [Candidatus Goldiibacteriota bacterium]